MQKESWKHIHPFSCNNFLIKKWVWPSHALSGGPACSTNILDHSLLDAKGIMEKYSSFSCNNILNKKWAWSCHAPRDADRPSTMHLQNLLLCIELCDCKKNFEKISNHFPVAKLQRFFADIPSHIMMIMSKFKHNIH